MKTIASGLSLTTSAASFLSELAERSEFYTGADFSGLMVNAEMLALQEQQKESSLNTVSERSRLDSNLVNFFCAGKRLAGQEQVETRQRLMTLTQPRGTGANSDRDLEEVVIERSNLEEALSNSRPSVSLNERQKFKKMCV